MSDVKKDHSIGAGTGAIAGAVTGAAVGSVAGPVGTVVGAVAGGAVGAKAGDSIAEAVNPTEYNSYFENNYKSVPYYQSGRDWSDYQPAYQYGYDTYGQYRGQKFEDVESSLERRRRFPGEPPSVPDDLLRLSVGIEDVENLWTDLDQALGSAGTAAEA